MEQKDYLLREIEKIGLILNAIRQRLFGGKQALALSIETQFQEAKGMLWGETGMDLNTIMSLNETELIGYVNKFEGLSTDNLELLADIIAQFGFEASADNSEKYLDKALQLYELCNITSKTYSPEREMKIAQIKNAK
ncbi:MAG: hypothetical protein KBB11_11260 [Bacteroidales bacterium]|nr:hypothetical protein [Bacteroidales bacterium]